MEEKRDYHVWIIAFLIVIGVVGIWFFRTQGPLGYAYTFSSQEPTAEVKPFEYGVRPSLSNPDFFASTKTELLKGGVEFVEANLSEMKLRVYKAGSVALEVPILTKGRKGSWWETPAGLYKAESKARMHESSFSPVYTLWNIQFQGNFFIHGWPVYTASDKPVDSKFSGGCIRLNTDDAKKVYDLVAPGMPILVFEEAQAVDTYTYAHAAPHISAKEYLAADLGNNFVFLKDGTENPVSLSLITKFLAALVATDYLNIEREIEAPQSALVNTWKPRLVAGQSYSVYQLLFPLLMESSNESAETLGSFFGRVRFVELMNEKAKAIGMTQTTLMDASGVSRENIGSAEDVFHLARYLYTYRKFILDLSNNVVENKVYGSHGWNDLAHTNAFKDVPEYVGGIAGVGPDGTQLGFAVFNLNLGNATRPIVFVALDSFDVFGDLRAMLEHVKSTYR